MKSLFINLMIPHNFRLGFHCHRIITNIFFLVISSAARNLRFLTEPVLSKGEVFRMTLCVRLHRRRGVYAEPSRRTPRNDKKAVYSCYDALQFAAGFFILAFFILISVTVSAVEVKKLDEIVTGIQANYEKVEDFHAKFTQEATVRALNKVQKADGEVWFKKPGKMRWNYYRPAKDEIVSDGITLWFYNFEEKQAIKSPIDKVMDTPTTTTFLSGLGNIKQQFIAKFSAVNQFDENGNYLIDLMPKEEDEDYNKVTIAVDKKSMIVKNIFLYDPFGNLTKVSLKGIEINKGVPDSLFKFKAPKGTEVIEAPSPVQQ
ncbi:MAG: outer membrane lipoprotein chaperone LolA [Thermodesulfobacteriota bacterium]